MKFIKIIKKPQLLFLLLLIIVIIPVLLPLFNAGFFVTDDGEWMIIRFSAFFQALSDGQFPVRFLHRLNFEYGYPVATFLYPGFMYAGVFFHILKIGFVETVKIILGLSLIGTTFFTYFWLAKLFVKKSAAFLGALVSLYIPYHLYDLYTRGSVGELFALLWVPFTLWMMERKNTFFVSVGLALLLVSHNTMALFFLPFIFIYGLIRKNFSLQQLLLSFLGGTFLSAFFTIPAVFELSLTSFAKTVISDPKNYFAGLALVGVSTIFIFLFAGGRFIFQKKSDIEYPGLVCFFLLVTLFTILLSSDRSAFLWQYIPAAVIQFPFRLLSFLLICLPFLAAFLVTQTNGKLKKVSIIVIVVASLVSAYQFIAPKEYIDKGEGYYATNEATTTVRDEYMPLWVQTKPSERPLEKAVITGGQGEITNVSFNNKKIAFTVDASDTVRVRINTVYWPGWEVFVNNNRVHVLYNNPEGVMEFDVAKGRHSVRAEFHETLVRLISDAISLLTFIILLGVLFKSRLKKS